MTAFSTELISNTEDNIKMDITNIKVVWEGDGTKWLEVESSCGLCCYSSDKARVTTMQVTLTALVNVALIKSREAGSSSAVQISHLKCRSQTQNISVSRCDTLPLTEVFNLLD